MKWKAKLERQETVVRSSLLNWFVSPQVPSDFLYEREIVIEYQSPLLDELSQITARMLPERNSLTGLLVAGACRVFLDLVA